MRSPPVHGPPWEERLVDSFTSLKAHRFLPPQRLESTEYRNKNARGQGLNPHAISKDAFKVCVFFRVDEPELDVRSG